MFALGRCVAESVARRRRDRRLAAALGETRSGVDTDTEPKDTGRE
jgi:hypothetical protein